MRCASLLLVCVLLLAALGFSVYSVRDGAHKAEALRLEAQQRRNSALEQETARLKAFVESPLCADIVKP